jgi:hypothetical protein
MGSFPWNAQNREQRTPLAAAVLSQELSVTLETTEGKLLHAVIHTDDGIAILLVALAALVVAALGLWCVLALGKLVRRK